jgi:hypothetical protein
VVQALACQQKRGSLTGQSREQPAAIIFAGGQRCQLVACGPSSASWALGQAAMNGAAKLWALCGCGAPRTLGAAAGGACAQNNAV